MSIVPLVRATVIGRTADRAAALAGLQDLGCLHIVGARGRGKPTEPEQPPEAERAFAAFRFLADCPHRRRQVLHDPDFDADALRDEALTVQAEERRLSDERDFLAKRISDLRPWGDFRFAPPDQMGGQMMWFYIVPHYRMRQVVASDLVWEEVHRDSRHAYVVVISPTEPPVDAMPVPRTHAGAESLSSLERRLEAVEAALEEQVARRAALTRYLDRFAAALARMEDEAHRAAAARDTDEDGPLFVLRAWAPAAAEDRLRAFADEQALALAIEPPGPDDAPPTLLDNPERLAGGEEILRFYSVPSYAGWDPSQVLFLSFALFFAMILSDAGYALLLGLVLALAWRRMERGRSARRLRTMATVLVGASVVWGMAVGSYFGQAPSPDSLPGLVHVLSFEDQEAMMALSIVIGAVHVIAANLGTAWRWRGGPRAVAPLGWIGVVGGGLALFAEVDPWIGGGVMAFGALLVFAFHAPLPGVAGPMALAGWTAGGLLAVANVTKAFGDVLSYLRLFALGLASAALAQTFNDLASQAAETPGLGLALAAGILLVGHALNFTLAAVSGVVHGLRLNLIEFYNWSVSEEGYPFRAFERREAPRWITS